MTNECLSVLCYTRKQPLEMDLLHKRKVSGQSLAFTDKKVQNWDGVKLAIPSQGKVCKTDQLWNGNKSKWRYITVFLF